MVFLYIIDLIDKDFASLQTKIYIIIALYIVAFFAVFLDFLSGVHKARKHKDLISSSGYRRSVDKAVKYVNLMACFTLIDIVLSLFNTVTVPFATIVVVVIVCAIEIKSIWERYDEKEKVRDAAKTLSVVLKNKKDLAKLLEALSQTENEKNKEKQTNKNEIS